LVFVKFLDNYPSIILLFFGYY